MPLTSERSVEIERPIEEVFEYTNENVAEWSITVVEDIPIETMPDGGVGSTFRCVTEDRGHRMEFEGIVTRHEPPNASAVNLVGKQFDIDVLYLFEDLDRRTRVTQVSVVQPKGLIMKLFFRVIGPFMKKSSCDAADKELASLKQYVESQPNA